jgi:hypothetical protein
MIGIQSCACISVRKWGLYTTCDTAMAPQDETLGATASQGTFISYSLAYQKRSEIFDICIIIYI